MKNSGYKQVYACVTSTLVTTRTCLHWNSAVVETYLYRNNIRTRQALATRLGCSKTLIYRCFQPDWSGEPTIELLARISTLLNLPIAALVCDPRGHVKSKELSKCLSFPQEGSRPPLHGLKEAQ